MMVNVQNRQQSGRIKTDCWYYCWYCQNIKSRKLVNTWDTADSLLPTMPSKLTFSDKSPCKIAVYFAVYFKDRKRAALSINGYGCQFGSLCRSQTVLSLQVTLIF